MHSIGHSLVALLLLLEVGAAAFALMPTSWIVERVESFANDSLGLPLDIGALELELLSTTPRARATNVSLGDGAGGTLVSGADIAVALDAGSLLGGDLVFDEVSVSSASVDLVVDEDGAGNWERLLPLPGANDTAADDTAAEGDGGALPAIRSLELDDIDVDYANRRLGQALSLSVSGSGSTTDPERPTTLEATGALDGVPLEADVELASLGKLSASLEDLTLDAEVSLGDTRLGVEGVVGDPATLGELDVELALSAPDVEDLETLAGISLPALPPLALSGTLERDGEDFVLRRFDATLGDSDFQGDVRLDPSTEPPTLYANVISRTLDLEDLAGITAGTPDPDGGAAPGRDSPDGDLLPDTPLDLRPLVDAFDGAIRYRARSVVSPAFPLDSIEARLEIDGDELILSPFEIGVGGGTVAGGVDLDVLPAPLAGTVELRVRGIDLQRVAQGLGLEDGSVGTIGGRAKYWLRGDSVASLAADADGGLFLLMTGGKLDALLAELASIDIVESVLLALDPDEALTDIDCGYLDLQTAAGLTEIERFVLDTADTVFIADGIVNLADESFDLAFEPHPKDASLLAASTGVRVSGTLEDFSVVPGAELGARVAVAAALAAIATPVAALLAFVDPGGARDSPYCDGLVEKLDEAR